MKQIIKDELKALYGSLSEDTFDLLDFQNSIWEIEEKAHDMDLYNPFAKILTMNDAASLSGEDDPYIYEYMGNIDTDLYTGEGKERYIDVEDHLDINEIFYDDIVTRLEVIIKDINVGKESIIDDI